MTTQDIIDLYKQGQSITYITNNSEYNYRQVRKIIADSGVPIRGGRKKKTLSEEQILNLQHRYCELSEDLNSLAKEIKWDKETLRNFINEQGWKKRTNNRINKNIKSDYFSTIDSPNKAYILGLLFTDGSVDKAPGKQGRIRLGLQSQDKAILEKIKEELNITSELTYDQRGKGCYSLEFSDDQIFQDLSKYNIVPNKTYVVQHLPTNIPKEYLKDYIRGLIDGDGSISFDETKSKDVTLHFTSYHESIAKDFQNLIDKFLIQKNNSNKLYFTSAWHCQWRGYQQVTKILDMVYKDADLYIDRKYNSYLQLLNRN